MLPHTSGLLPHSWFNTVLSCEHWHVALDLQSAMPALRSLEASESREAEMERRLHEARDHIRDLEGASHEAAALREQVRPPPVCL